MKILFLLFLPFLFQDAFSKTVGDLCTQVQKKADRFSMGKIDCTDVDWEFARYSRGGYPLINKRFGNDPSNAMLLICGVHGDEHSSPYFCFKLAKELSELQKTKPESVPNIAIAPIVNPDGFFAGTRHNKNGVDVNRNFPTSDFKSSALKEWKKIGSPKRKFPGSALEPETVFQLKLIEVYNPKKIVSIHSPLNFIDYDGPSVKWALEAAEQHKQLPFKNYRTFVGSLGRYAGEEKKIPTFTVEFQHAAFKKEEIGKIYEQFQEWMFALIKLNPEIKEVDEAELAKLMESTQVSQTEKDNH